MDSYFFANFSMRARFMALAILFLIFSIPAWIYWYFFSKNTSSLTIMTDDDSVFFVRLEWTIDNEYLPLADQLLLIERECSGVCTISPLAPVRYALTLTSSGKVDIKDTIVIWVDKSATLSYTLYDEVQLTPSSYIPRWDNQVADTILTRISSDISQIQYSLIDVDSENTVYVERNISGRREIWTITSEKFTSLYTVSNDIVSIVLDKTGQYFILSTLVASSIVLSLDGGFQKEIPPKNILGYVHSDTEEKIYTASWILGASWERYNPNIRFTDWIDLDWSMRIWYIAAEDKERLSLSDLPLGQWVLVAVDRKNGASHIIKRWIDIVALFYIGSTPVLLDSSGKAWNITL